MSGINTSNKPFSVLEFFLISSFRRLVSKILYDITVILITL